MIRRGLTGTSSNRANAPISPSEFLNELLKIWRPQEAPGRHPQGTKIGKLSRSLWNRSIDFIRLGLCVSGGSDSMALAYLFQELKRLDIGPKLDLTALIVDHNHRADSGQEALTVSKRLEGLGSHGTITLTSILTRVQASNPELRK